MKVYLVILVAAWVLLLAVVAVVAADDISAMLGRLNSANGDQWNLVAGRALLIWAADAWALLTMRLRREG